MNNYMVDTTHDGLPQTKADGALDHCQIVATYGTGSSGIIWTTQDYGEIPAGLEVVVIDQGGNGSPIPHAHVRDVESGAWSVSAAIDKTGWNPPNGRYVIYCSVDTIQPLLDAGWRDEIWVAAPEGSFPVPYTHPGANIIAQQYLFNQGTNGEYDVSVVFDTTWPKPKTVLTGSVTVNSRLADLAFQTLKDADHYVIKYGNTVLLRMAATTLPVMHVNDLQVPGSHGGSLTVSPIVHGKATDVITLNLP